MEKGSEKENEPKNFEEILKMMKDNNERARRKRELESAEGPPKKKRKKKRKSLTLTQMKKISDENEAENREKDALVPSDGQNAKKDKIRKAQLFETKPDDGKEYRQVKTIVQKRKTRKVKEKQRVTVRLAIPKLEPMPTPTRDGFENTLLSYLANWKEKADAKNAKENKHPLEKEFEKAYNATYEKIVENVKAMAKRVSEDPSLLKCPVEYRKVSKKLTKQERRKRLNAVFVASMDKHFFEPRKEKLKKMLNESEEKIRKEIAEMDSKIKAKPETLESVTKYLERKKQRKLEREGKRRKLLQQKLHELISFVEIAGDQTPAQRSEVSEEELSLRRKLLQIKAPEVPASLQKLGLTPEKLIKEKTEIREKLSKMSLAQTASLLIAKQKQLVKKRRRKNKFLSNLTGNKNES